MLFVAPLAIELEAQQVVASPENTKQSESGQISGEYTTERHLPGIGATNPAERHKQ